MHHPACSSMCHTFEDCIHYLCWLYPSFLFAIGDSGDSTAKSEPQKSSDSPVWGHLWRQCIPPIITVNWGNLGVSLSSVIPKICIYIYIISYHIYIYIYDIPLNHLPILVGFVSHFAGQTADVSPLMGCRPAGWSCCVRSSPWNHPVVESQ